MTFDKPTARVLPSSLNRRSSAADSRIGVFPESLAKGRRNDVLVDYCETGKRSYYLASTYSDTPKQQEEAPILRRLSVDFETCMEGLRKVRVQWQQQ